MGSIQACSHGREQDDFDSARNFPKPFAPFIGTFRVCPCEAAVHVVGYIFCEVSVSLCSLPSAADICELLQREGSHPSPGRLCGRKASGACTHHHHWFCQDRPRYLGPTPSRHPHALLTNWIIRCHYLKKEKKKSLVQNTG